MFGRCSVYDLISSIELSVRSIEFLEPWKSPLCVRSMEGFLEKFALSAFSMNVSKFVTCVTNLKATGCSQHYTKAFYTGV